MDPGQPTQSQESHSTSLQNYSVPQVGSMLGKYQLLNQIGEGGMSVVFKARDAALNRYVAIKFLLPRPGMDAVNLLRFQQEAKAVSIIVHPNVVHIFDFNVTEDGIPFLVMAFLDGISLSDAIKREGPMSVSRWLSLMLQACDGLDNVHRNGILHRDIKPGNFVLSRENGTEVLKLVDFGIAKISLEDQSLTKTGDIFGSPLYMSPEQCAGLKVDARSDIYSLGCVMYEALAGTAPLVGANSLNTMQKQISEKPESLKKKRPDLKDIDAIDRMVMKCLSKNKDDRYENLGALHDELSRLFQGEKRHLEQISRTTKLVVLLASVMVIATIAFFAFRLGKSSGDDQPSIASKTALPAPVPTDTETLQPRGSSGEQPNAASTSPGGSAAKSEHETEEGTESRVGTHDAIDDPMSDARTVEAFVRKYKMASQTFKDQNNWDLALKQLNECLIMARAAGRSPTVTGEITSKIAVAEQRLGDHAAKLHFLEALSIVRDTNEERANDVKWVCYKGLGTDELRPEVNHTQKAADYMRKAYEISVNQQNIKKQAMSLEYLGECARRENNVNGCIKYWTMAAKLKNKHTMIDKLNDYLAEHHRPLYVPNTESK